MSDMPHPPVHSAAMMVGARIANMAVGLLTIPVLIRYLGGEGFAAWAILLALAAGFSLLEMGMAPTAVRFLALPVRDRDWDQVRRVLGQVWLLLALTFGAGWLLTSWFAGAFAAWLRLPGTALFAAADSLRFVLAVVAARAVLQSGTLVLSAAGRFGAVSAVSLLQPLCSNFAAMAVAWQTRRLDLTLVAYWSAQLAVLGVTFFLTRRMSVPRFGSGVFDLRRLRELCYYGLSNQMEGWAQFVNFQFDKFLVAGMVGLWGVAPYEVANRAAAALRSIPASGAETFLPIAMNRRQDPDEAWAWYLASTRIAAYGVCVFLLVPLAIAPLMLYVWTGEMGYFGRWVFFALALGAAASVLSLPAATLAQAEGLPELQGRAAAAAVLINIPLSLLLVVHWGLAGAAAGTAIAMVIGAAQLVLAVHRRFARPLKETRRVLAAFWPPVTVCLCWGIGIHLLFAAWFATLDPLVRFSRETRVYPGVIGLLLYAACAASMLAIEIRRGALGRRELGALAGAFNLRR